MGAAGHQAGHVFISYRHEDLPHADRLQSTLAAAGFDVWRDKEELWPGDDWRAVIRTAITRNALVFLACFSEASLARARSLQNEELALAIEQFRQLSRGHRWLIPVRFDGCRLPDIDLGAGRTLESLIRCDLFGAGEEAATARLVRVITLNLGCAPQAPAAGAVPQGLPGARGSNHGSPAAVAGTVTHAADGRNPDHVADLLATAVRRQWERAAGERGLTGIEPIPVTWGTPSLPLAGPVTAATGSRRFSPLPGFAPVEQKALAAGQLSELLAVYAGLRSGRLVIAGAPGSGKTGTAILLTLAALRHRERASAQDRPEIPVPLLVTARAWDPRRQQVQDWLTRELRQTYPLFAGPAGPARAARLVGAGKIAVIIDGLDEIAEELQPIAIQALNQQAGLRIVVLSRTAELASAASKHGVLQAAAAIELRPVGPGTAAAYLELVQLDPPPDGWRDLLGQLRAAPSGPLARALSTPLTLTLVRDTCLTADDSRRLLEFCGAAGRLASGGQVTDVIVGYLLDRVLPTAYIRRPGQPRPRYSLHRATDSLAKIADRMNQDGTRDLPWWGVLGWTPVAGARAVITGLAVAVVAGLIAGLFAGLAAGLAAAIGTGAAAAVTALLAGLSRDHAPARTWRPRPRQALRKDNLPSALAGGLPAGIGTGLATALGAGIGPGVAAALIACATIGSAALTDPDTTSAPSPLASRRNSRNYATLTGLAAGLIAGLAAGLTQGTRSGLIAGSAAGLMTGLSSSQTWACSLAAAQLTARWHTPVRLLNFLEDARERGVLRTAGPAYQFRHARLQDRLAVTSTRDAHVKPTSYTSPADSHTIIIKRLITRTRFRSDT